jgi:hypothetical protein
VPLSVPVPVSVSVGEEQVVHPSRNGHSRNEALRLPVIGFWPLTLALVKHQLLEKIPGLGREAPGIRPLEPKFLHQSGTFQPVAAPRVDHVPYTERLEEGPSGRAAGGSEDFNTKIVRDLNCGHPDATRTRVHQDTLAPSHPRDILQCVPGGHERELIKVNSDRDKSILRRPESILYPLQSILCRWK